MGKVKLARHNSTGEKCAVKIVPRAAKLYQRAHANDPPPKTHEEAAHRQKEFEKEIARDKRTIREGALGRLLFHPHICRLYEMVPMTNHYYMLFEYVEGGQLLDYIVSHGSLNEKYARKFARGVASALDYCHRNNVVHRDLKIENIMINQKGDIKIIDFGLSNLYSPQSLLKTYCGSLYFAAPELLSAKPYTGPEVDVWSFGVVLYVLVCGKVPFDDPVVSVLHEKIKRGNVEYPSFISRDCVSLLSRMLVVDPTKRATLQEVIQHPWMNRGYEYATSNYLPKRAPLTLPLEPEIIKTMASYDLGSSQSILEELTSIVSSVEYQVSSEAWYKSVKQGRQLMVSSSNPSIQDPTCGFSPLVSIYYLVQETRRRKKAKEDALKAHLNNQLEENPQGNHEQISQQIALQRQQHNTPQLVSASNVSPLIAAQSQGPASSQVPSDARSPQQRPSKPQNQSLQPPAELSDYNKPELAGLTHSRSASGPYQLPQSGQQAKRPEEPSPVPLQQIPTLQFPEQAHTSVVPSTFQKESQSPTPSNEGKIHQQMVLQHSPRASLSGNESPDAHAKQLGINSLLRKLSGKRSHNPNSSPIKGDSTSPRKGSPSFEPVIMPPSRKAPSSRESPNALSPQSSIRSNRNDPLVRRGVSMKVTAKEKSGAGRTDPSRDALAGSSGAGSGLASRQRERVQTKHTLDPHSQHFRGHARSSSTSTSKPHSFIPTEDLPPLPNISAGGAGIIPNEYVEPKTSERGKNYHPTARAKSVGGHVKKDGLYPRNGEQTIPDNKLPSSMVSQNSDEGIDGEQERDDAIFDDVALDEKEYPNIPPMTETQIVTQFHEAKRNTMPSIEYPKTLFLKGFFSVQTTSTKPLPVIRYNIICVLTKLGVKFQEVKGGFVCVHSPSIAAKPEEESDDETSAIIDEYRLDENSEEKRLYGDAFNASSESVQKHDLERVKTPDYEASASIPQIQTPLGQTTHGHALSSRQPLRQPSLHLNTNMLSPPAPGPSGMKGHQKSNSIGGGQHRRKFSIGQSILGSYKKKNGSQTLLPPNTPAAARLNKLLLGAADIEDEDLDEYTRAHLQQHTDDDSADSLNEAHGGSDMLISSRIEQRARHLRSPNSSLKIEEGADGSEGVQQTKRSPLKFEINIVKVPLVGLFGVQFKKTLGNTWNYKTLASQILEELNL